jgi:diphosphomevalonate decarboxylase
VFFTVDAGPQVKAVCLQEAATAVRAALARVPGVIRLIESRLGAGARVVPTNG